MAGRIPEEFIESLLERTDIVEIVGARVDLKPAGRGEYKALCPFHDEKTPSFTVSTDKQFYHCFGCGAHGTAIGFVMQHDGLEFPAAIEELAHIAGLEVPHEGGQAPVKRNDRLYQALSQAQTWFRRQLAASEAARAYLKSRGFDKATVDEFGIGYAPDAWQSLADFLINEGFRPQELEEAGLVTRRDGRTTDKFRDRVMFPIHDRRGRVIAFGGRALGERGPKYMNSPETPVFHKGRELYRLFQVRRGGLPPRILVVEGYMDAAALFQYGFDNAVATLGTSVTPDHMNLLFRASPVVVFCFDGDRAGLQAAWRGLEAALPELKSNREVRFLFLPEGEDPDSLVRGRGAQTLARMLDEAKPLSSFFFDHLSESLDMKTLDGRARLVALAEPYLEKLPEGAFADMMHDELVRRSGHGGRSRPAAEARPETSRVQGGEEDRPLTPVQYAVALIVQRPSLADGVDDGALEGPATVRGVDFLRELIDFCRNKPQFSTAKLLEAWRERREAPWLARLAARNVIADREEMPTALAQTLARIRRQMIQTRIRELQEAQLNEGGLDEDRSSELRRLTWGNQDGQI
ncbi:MULTISPECIES: DNA primase [unclassified Wenzhouxiangella]|uniref:DNA primase n=1 Tax=unclassified Wenzhouxiangella TaxID=2613841 RepID=UPI000E32B00A|nr:MULTISPECIES: DNA primase [unclassified Wenzhouxiangella]RFF28593.1 DNA primase [Wenzhouxiangella sp. 15181]RFP68132.1 DNA primase [Wenzhouxiangella sp. 15190]